MNYFNRVFGPGYCKHGLEGDRCLEDEHYEHFDVLDDRPERTASKRDTYRLDRPVRPAQAGDVGGG